MNPEVAFIESTLASPAAPLDSAGNNRGNAAGIELRGEQHVLGVLPVRETNIREGLCIVEFR
jgi:hypothetical protein